MKFKNFFSTALFALLMFLPVYASDKLHVEALEKFESANPKETFSVKVIEEGEMNGVILYEGNTINCIVTKVTDPTRAKRDAQLYLKVVSWSDEFSTHEVKEELIAKYAPSVLNKEKIKELPNKENAKKAAGFVGGFFVKGFSYGLSFIDGFATNKEDNRLKSAAKQVYEDSFLSYVEYGDELVINPQDKFYLIINNKTKDNDKANNEVKNEATETKDGSKE